MSGKRKKKKKRAARGRPEASGRAGTNAAAPTGGLHFTVGAGVSVEPATGKLTLENDARLLKAGLLYADRVRLVSVGSSLTLRMLDDAGSGPKRRLDFLERFFRDTVSRDDPEKAAVGIEIIRDYRELKRGRNLNRDQLARRLKLSRELGEAWGTFRTRWEGIAREAGIDEILAARRSGFVDIDGFAAGPCEGSSSPRSCSLSSVANAVLPLLPN